MTRSRVLVEIGFPRANSYRTTRRRHGKEATPLVPPGLSLGGLSTFVAFKKVPFAMVVMVVVVMVVITAMAKAIVITVRHPLLPVARS